MEFDEDGNRVADSPVASRRATTAATPRQQASTDLQERQAPAQAATNGGGSLTPNQLNAIQKMSKTLGWSEEDLNSKSGEMFARNYDQLGRQDASKLIEAMGKLLDERGPKGTSSNTASGSTQQRSSTGGSGNATAKQIKYIKDLIRDKTDHDPDAFDFDDPPLAFSEAQNWIENLKLGRFPEGALEDEDDSPNG
jgi:UDP-N-acetylenolpyruvoylglucosamine reductase